MKCLILAFSVCVLVMTEPLAGGNHHETTNIYNVAENSQTIKTTSSGTATAISASQLNFDWGSYALQGSIGYGNYNGENALTIGIAKRFGWVLLSGSAGAESNTSKRSLGAGVSWKF